MMLKGFSKLARSVKTSLVVALIVLNQLSAVSLVFRKSDKNLEYILRGDDEANDILLGTDLPVRNAKLFIIGFGNRGGSEGYSSKNLVNLGSDVGVGEEKQIDIPCPQCAIPSQCLFNFVPSPDDKLNLKDFSNLYLACNKFHTKTLDELKACEGMTAKVNEFKNAYDSTGAKIYQALNGKSCNKDGLVYHIAGPGGAVPIAFHASPSADNCPRIYYEINQRKINLQTTKLQIAVKEKVAQKTTTMVVTEVPSSWFTGIDLRDGPLNCGKIPTATMTLTQDEVKEAVFVHEINASQGVKFQQNLLNFDQFVSRFRVTLRRRLV